jgi:hypothetical protein
MAVTTAVCNQFKADLLGMATHAAGNTYKLVLVKLSHGGTYGAGTISVGATVDGSGSPTTTLLGTDAISASNSTMGTYDVTGFTLNSLSATLQSSTGCLDFGASPSAATGTTISAVGALIYNSTQATGKTLAAYDFGGTITSTGGNFTVTVPAVGASTSLVRIA